MLELSKGDHEGLLTSFDKLQIANEKKKQLGIHDYSLMNALLKKTDEVNLHSNFIYSMINPDGSHYCGNKFLELFLESIEASGFIDLNNARVHKEKGKIDLLIEDGKNVIIIENKLRAPDQPHQISRYIHHVIAEYIEESDLIDDKIRVVYLSEYKEIPTKRSESIIGFEEIGHESKELIWKGERTVLCNDNTCNFLKKGTKLQFNRVQHSKKLSDWANESRDWLDKNRPKYSGLVYAFDEYKLILKRLDTKNQWRNIMSLDEYALGLAKDEQEKMSQFMEDACKKLNDYKGKKLFREINELFQHYSPKRCVLNGVELSEFNETHCIRWFQKWKKSDSYRDVAVEIEINNERYILALGVKKIAFGKSIQSDGTKIWDFKKNIVSNREKDIFYTLSKIKDKLPNLL